MPDSKWLSVKKDKRHYHYVCNHCKSVLRYKKREIFKLEYVKIKEDMMWKIFVENVWNNRENIALCDIVDDIINYDSKKIIVYYLNSFDNSFNE
jgi:glutaredoxin